jgi:hypothetical protein
VPSRPVSEEEILQKLDFAERRMIDLLNLSDDASGFEWHMLAEEFFFHLLGAIEITAQFVNEVCALKLDPDDVTTNLVLRKLNQYPLVRAALATLYVNPRKGKAPMPSDPYSPEGMLYRAYNYRHQVTHRRGIPFLYRAGSTPRASFILDPRALQPMPSERSLQEEMSQMLQLIRRGCRGVLGAVQAQP